jgi:glycosyltransferase involved in cell wall biosynthesis
MPLKQLSVIIPTYDRSSYLPDAVDSALAQVDVEVEVIIVDDGSTDDTRSIVEKNKPGWGQRVTYVWQENSERCMARNNGFKRSSGEFIAFLDSDDLWRPDHAIKCIDLLLANEDAAAVYGEYGLIDSEGRLISEFVKRPDSEGYQFLRDLCLKRLILHPTEVVIRRHYLNGQEIFDPEIPGAEDWLLWVRLAHRAPIARIGEPTVWMRVHRGGTFGNPDKFSRSLMSAAEKVIATGLPARLGISANRIMAINRMHCAYSYYLAARNKESFKYLLAAIRNYPAAPKEKDFWIVAARLCAGPWLSSRVRAIRQHGRGSVVRYSGNGSKG